MLIYEGKVLADFRVPDCEKGWHSSGAAAAAADGGGRGEGLAAQRETENAQY